VSLHGLAAARDRAAHETAAAVAALATVPGDTSFLRALAEWMRERAK
jgi:hypothetical protein